MSEQYDRLEKKDLALAVDIGDNTQRGLLVRLPQLSSGETFTPLNDSNYGQPLYSHIYSGRKKSKVLQSAHIAINHMYFGTMQDTDTTVMDLAWKVRNFEEDRDYKDSKLAERLDGIIADYVDVREMQTMRRAKSLGAALASRTVYILASHPPDTVNGDFDLYAAPAVDMTVLREKNKIAMEPVVEGLSGKRGLMPENFYSLRGLYAPVIKSME